MPEKIGHILSEEHQIQSNTLFFKFQSGLFHYSKNLDMFTNGIIYLMNVPSIAVQEKLPKDSGVAGVATYDSIVTKLLSKRQVSHPICTMYIYNKQKRMLTDKM